MPFQSFLTVKKEKCIKTRKYAMKQFVYKKAIVA